MLVHISQSRSFESSRPEDPAKIHRASASFVRDSWKSTVARSPTLPSQPKRNVCKIFVDRIYPDILRTSHACSSTRPRFASTSVTRCASVHDFHPNDRSIDRGTSKIGKTLVWAVSHLFSRGVLFSVRLAGPTKQAHTHAHAHTRTYTQTHTRYVARYRPKAATTPPTRLTV